MSDFPSRLRFAITNYAAGAISYKSFAAMADLPYRTLQNYLSGERSPNIEALAKFANNGININWLVTGEGTPYTISELERSLLDIVFVLHSKDIIKSAFDRQKNLYDERQRVRLLSFITSNNFLNIGDIVKGTMDNDERYAELENLTRALAAGDLEDLFDDTPSNRRELWKALQALKETKSRDSLPSFPVDKIKEK